MIRPKSKDNGSVRGDVSAEILIEDYPSSLPKSNKSSLRSIDSRVEISIEPDIFNKKSKGAGSTRIQKVRSLQGIGSDKKDMDKYGGDLVEKLEKSNDKTSSISQYHKDELLVSLILNFVKNDKAIRLRPLNLPLKSYRISKK